MEKRRSVLVFFLVTLAGAAGLVLGLEERARTHRQGTSEEFQRLVGGLGFGPATELSGCAFSFDPRLDGDCSENCGSIPGGACFCPRHAGSLFFYRSLEGTRSASAGEEGNASSP